MTQIKHVSFDVWGTLLTANPEFARRRTALLADMLGLDEAIVKRAYQSTKKCVDDMAEKHGDALSTDGVYRALFMTLDIPVGVSTIALTRKRVEDLFELYPPTIVNSVRTTIKWLRDHNISMNIASNSNFISGDVMYPFLQKQFDNAFSFGVFSDLILTGKPSPVFFHQVSEGAADLTWFNNEILHVGDNPICDGEGAINARMQAALVLTPNDLFPVVRSRFFIK